jgi:hypothetical protein
MLDISPYYLEKMVLTMGSTLTLEQDFQTLSRYLEPCEANNNAFSIELSRIIMSSPQEVDVILKSLCKLIDPNYGKGGINSYYPVLREHLNTIFSEEVSAQRFSMASQPFSDWKPEEPPLWWQANNKIKHHRSTNFDKATLKNAFNSLAGLLIVTVNYYQIVLEEENITSTTQKLIPETSLFKLKEQYDGRNSYWATNEW